MGESPMHTRERRSSTGRLRAGLSALGGLLGRFVVLPIDCLFFLYDSFAVNLRKTGIFGSDCRAGLPDAAEGPCRPASKYTNKWLFRLVCPDAHRREEAPGPACGVTGAVRLYLLRGLLGLTGLAVAMVGGIIVGVCAMPQPTTAHRTGASLEGLVRRRKRMGDRAFSSGRYEEALGYFLAALRIEPDNRRTQYRIGVCLQETGQQARALKYLREAAEGEEGLPAAMHRLALGLYRCAYVRLAAQYATMALEHGEHSNDLVAIAATGTAAAGSAGQNDSCVEKTLGLAENSPAVRLAKAYILTTRGERERAEALLDGVDEGAAYGPAALVFAARLRWHHDRREEAVGGLEKLAEKYPDLKGARMLLVRVLLAAGRGERALKEVRKMRRTFRRDPILLLNLALTLEKCGRAGPMLEIALDLQEQNGFQVTGHVLAAEAYLKKRLPQRALYHAGEALAVDPGDADALVMAGRAECAADREGRGRRQLLEATRLHPKKAEAWYRLGMAWMASERTEEALQNFQIACEIQPDAGEYRYQFGQALLAAGRLEEAARQFSRAAETMEDPARAYTRLGAIANAEGRTEEAIGRYSKALTISPARAIVASNDLAAILLQKGRNLPLALALAYAAYLRSGDGQLASHTADTLAEALIRTGNAGRALRLARFAARNAPRDPERCLRLGIAEAAAGNRDSAALALEKTVALGERTPAADRARRLLLSIAVPQDVGPESP